MMKKIIYKFLWFLETIGRTSIDVIRHGVRDFTEYIVLIFKLIWGRSVIIRTKIADVFKKLFEMIALPFAKMWIEIHNMQRDMKIQRQDNGFKGGVSVFLPYFARFAFGKHGLAVTLFNYTVPILSVVFLLNVVSFATTTTYNLKLTVNGDFLGYIENEQVFLDAEAFVLERVNYFGSDNTIEMNPEFSIISSSDNEFLTMNQVANLIFKNADFNMKYAYGFFIDGVCYGAVLEENIPLIREAVSSLLDKYVTGNPDEEVGFLNHVEWETYELFLEESIVEPQEIITMITATIDDEPFLPVAITRTEEYDVGVPHDIEYGYDDNEHEGSSRTVQQGIDGVNHIVARVSYINNEEIRRNVIETTVVSEPQTKIINKGTKQYEGGVVSAQHAEYFIWPVVTADGQPVGNISPGQHFRDGHAAIDIVGRGINGTPIVAGASGQVVLAQYNYSGYGHTVIIEHENGLRTLYAHNSALQVSEGDWVIQGDQIANLGNTGNSTGPHLHFEVMDGNRKLNPTDYLP